jgi:hypothetical protein
LTRRLSICVLLLTLLLGLSPAAAETGTGTPNMRHVASLAYKKRWGEKTSFGTDIEFARIRGRNYALAGTYRNGLQIVDITRPRRPSITAVYDCGIAQGDTQVFRRGARTLVTYTADGSASNTFPNSRCYRDVGIRRKAYGTFIVDITNPKRPVTAGFIEVTQGSHNQSVHPSGRFMYNSNADSRIPSAIEVIDISDVRRPRIVKELPLDTGFESHDITFSSHGKRAYAAALTHTLIIDTTDAANPKIIGRIIDPAIDLHHQSDPITVNDPLLGERTFLVVTDELNGAAGNGYCPGGGLHVYDITGDLEQTPVKVGFWAIPEVWPAVGNFACTAHVLRFYPERRLMTIAWYDAGVRVVDVSGLAGVSVGAAGRNVGPGMREIGYYTLPDADTWSAKTNHFESDGSFYLFANDINRGLDVYRFDASMPVSGLAGTWLTPAQALAAAEARRGPTSTARAFTCMLLSS